MFSIWVAPSVWGQRTAANRTSVLLWSPQTGSITGVLLRTRQWLIYRARRRRLRVPSSLLWRASQPLSIMFSTEGVYVWLNFVSVYVEQKVCVCVVKLCFGVFNRRCVCVHTVSMNSLGGRARYAGVCMLSRGRKRSVIFSMFVSR
jgi:hypothetical protein